MAEKKNEHIMLPDEVITNKIYLIRGEKVMLDRDLAELYGVETKYLKHQVRRNILRFPDDFMFELTEKELQLWRSQFGTSKSEKMGLRYPPFAPNWLKYSKPDKTYKKEETQNKKPGKVPGFFITGLQYFY